MLEKCYKSAVGSFKKIVGTKFKSFKHIFPLFYFFVRVVTSQGAFRVWYNSTLQQANGFSNGALFFLQRPWEIKIKIFQRS